MTIPNGYDLETTMDRSVTLAQNEKLSVESLFDRLLETHMSGREEMPSL
jgi:hypothetical protein